MAIRQAIAGGLVGVGAKVLEVIDHLATTTKTSQQMG